MTQSCKAGLTWFGKRKAPWKVQLILLDLPTPRKQSAWRLVLSLIQLEGCSFLLSANQSPSQYNYLQLYFTIVHLLRGFLSRGIGQKDKELFLGFGLWESSLILFTHCLLRFAQPNHRQVLHQAQVNGGKQLVSSQPMAIEQPRHPITLYCDNY